MLTLPLADPVKFPKNVYLNPIFSLLGSMANWILFGVLCAQVYLYYVAFPKDTRLLKWIVIVLFLLEAIQTITWAQDTIEDFTAVFSDPDAFNVVHTVWSVPLLTGMIACVTQSFYCYRIGVLTESKFAVTLISMLAFGQLAAAIALAVQTQRAGLETKLLSESISLVAFGIWCGLSLACDVVIATIMTYHLRKRNTGFKSTSRIVGRLIKQSIETGCITALSAGAFLVLVYLPGHPPYFIFASSIEAKLYSNSMMAMLNSRIKPVSNQLAFGAPIWNESLPSIESVYSTKGAQGIVFRGPSDSESDFGSAAGIDMQQYD